MSSPRHPIHHTVSVIHSPLSLTSLFALPSLFQSFSTSPMSSRPKQSMSELKLRRLLEHNQRLREDLGRPRIRVSEASASLIRYCKTTTDHLVSLSLFFPSQSDHLHHFHDPLYPSHLSYLFHFAAPSILPLSFYPSYFCLMTDVVCGRLCRCRRCGAPSERTRTRMRRRTAVGAVPCNEKIFWPLAAAANAPRCEAESVRFFLFRIFVYK